MVRKAFTCYRCRFVKVSSFSTNFKFYKLINNVKFYNVASVASVSVRFTSKELRGDDHKSTDVRVIISNRTSLL